VEYRVLGPVEVVAEQRTPPLGGYRQRLVLAVLLSRPNQVLGADWLVDAVWGERPPRTARKTLQVYLTRLRHLLGDDAIVTTPAGYRLHTAVQALDSLRFEHLAEQGRAALPTEPRRAAGFLRQALALWRGSAFGDLGDAPALRGETTRLHEVRLGALEDRLDADLACSHGGDLVPELTDLVAEHPLRERLRGQLMLALHRAGRQAEALAGYEQTRRLLADELGTDPTEPLRTVHEQILRHDPSLDAAAGASDVEEPRQVRNPYKGLRPFSEADAGDFFGRDDLVEQLTAAVSTHPLVALVGASGSGKSSAVRAGLVPRLRTAQPPGWSSP
jgi:DNA-binding SARP family transcriptional activator